MSHSTKPQFRILEHENSAPCIVLDPLDGDQEQTFKRAIRFQLKADASLDEAKAILGFLQDNLVAVSEQD